MIIRFIFSTMFVSRPTLGARWDYQLPQKVDPCFLNVGAVIPNLGQVGNATAVGRTFLWLRASPPVGRQALLSDHCEQTRMSVLPLTCDVVARVGAELVSAHQVIVKTSL